MVTVQHLVKKELDNNPYLADMLQQELINVSAAATKILPAVAKELGKEIKLSAVSMAIRRYSKELSQKTIHSWKFPKNLEISTKSQIYEVAIEKTPNIAGILNQLNKERKKLKGEFFSVVEGTYEIVLFTNQTNKKQVLQAIRGQNITSECNNLTYVTVNWPKITKDIPGIYYRITRALAFKGIPIQSFHTIGSEMTIFFKEDVFSEAHQTIMQLLQNRITF